jgi:hypothetical protein
MRFIKKGQLSLYLHLQKYSRGFDMGTRIYIKWSKIKLKLIE